MAVPSNSVRTITSGPSRFDLACHGVYAQEQNDAQKYLPFRVSDSQMPERTWTEMVRIQRTARSSGNGYEFEFMGYTEANRCYVKIYYSLKGNKGTIDYLPMVTCRCQAEISRHYNFCPHCGAKID